ncbi:MAG: Fic family protein [Oscillospiraceae bacterium]|nr:Fic family protein [Oscillospiraceae bacterium]
MTDKFNMTVEQNIFVAKRNIVDYIWKSANLEGITVTYPDTEAIFNGLSLASLKVSEIVAINNLKHAWQFVLETTNYPTDYPLICEIHRKVGGDNLITNAGFIRNVPVLMGGTSWRPDMPIESQIKEQLAEILSIPEATEKALTLMLYCMRKQMFLDGNKRTAMLAANHVMIANGAGIVTVPIELQREFRRLLINFYESGDMSEIKMFLYDNCIDGIAFQNEKTAAPNTQEKPQQSRDVDAEIEL